MDLTLTPRNTIHIQIVLSFDGFLKGFPDIVKRKSDTCILKINETVVNYNRLTNIKSVTLSNLKVKHKGIINYYNL